MKPTLCKFLFLPLLAALQSYVGGEQEFSVQLGRTPLCEKCRCRNKTLEDPDVDCSESGIDNNFFNVTNWIDPMKNVTYSIASVNLQNNSLGELTKPFVNSSLIKLDLGHNKLRKIGDLTFQNLKNLDTLILSNNVLSDLKPEVFKGQFISGQDYPIRLRVLKLDNNDFHTLNRDVFQHIERYLENLYLSHNPFKVIDQNTELAINGIFSLKLLDLSHTQIKELPENFFHAPKYLTVVNLSGNKFEEIPKTFADSHVLQTLFFNENPLKHLTENNTFPAMPSLRVLHMCRMPELERLEKGALSGLTNLTELHLAYNMKLNHLDTASLTRKDMENERWPPIEKLYINNNQLTHLDSHLLAHWDRLQELDIRGNPWTCECENQWMVDSLIGIFVVLNETNAREVECGAPIEMTSDTLYELWQRKSEMRCLDLYGNRPERDGALLIGVLAGTLIGIPIVLFAMYAYQRRWFGLFDNSPAAYSRQFYGKTSTDDF